MTLYHSSIFRQKDRLGHHLGVDKYIRPFQLICFLGWNLNYISLMRNSIHVDWLVLHACLPNRLAMNNLWQRSISSLGLSVKPVELSVMLSRSIYLVSYKWPGQLNLKTELSAKNSFWISNTKRKKLKILFCCCFSDAYISYKKCVP